MAASTPTPGNLPVEVNALVGRRRELEQLLDMLGMTRLLTLIGPGGVGKSRLAVAVARVASASFPDGVWKASLAELTRPELLCSSIASLLSPGQVGDTLADLADAVGERRVLLILDNCEHLVREVAEVASEMVQHSPNAVILATSREPLRVDGELLFRLAPFAVAEGLDRHGPASDAVELFFQRADAVVPGFSARPGVQGAVVELCQRLDGLPLAIELAAAATRLFPIVDLREGTLNLTGGSRSAPDRQQTLRATMTYSYSLCSSSAQLLWARMSIFRGGADLRAIEDVCADSDLPSDRIWQTLGELVDKSIVTFDGGRYTMLHTVREFGQERLKEQRRTTELSRRHCDHYAQLAADLDAGWFGPDQPALFSQVLLDRPNLRAALEYTAKDPAYTEVGLALVSDLYMFWNCCGPLSEGRYWLDELLELTDPQAPARVRALSVDAFVSAMLGHEARAARLLEEGIDLATALGDREGEALVIRMRGMTELVSQPAKAIADLRLSMRLEEELGSAVPYQVEALVSLGVAHCYEREAAEATLVLQEARDLCAAEGEEFYLSWCLVMLGLAALIDERVTDAVPLVREGLRTKLLLSNTPGIHYALEFLAWAAAMEGDAVRAARLMGASEALFAPVGQHLLGFPRLLEWHQTHRAHAQDVLGDAFDVERERGRMLTLAAAAQYALGTEEDAAAARDPGLPLTPREVQIARMVSQGMTNRQIASSLVIARRTVDSHVEHILGKLNFTSRKQIASVVLPASPDPTPGIDD